MYVCLYLYNTITLKSCDTESSFFVLRIHLKAIRVKFVYESHQVKVKVSGAKKDHKNPYSRSVKLRSGSKS